eukprot:8080913-Karenia_brevis.AAC.1
MEDIGCNIDPQKWEKFQKKPGIKRSTEGGDENQAKRQHPQGITGAREREQSAPKEREKKK